MQCSFCGYEYTMREMQADAPCPKCAEQKAIEDRAAEIRAEKRVADAALAPHVKKVMDDYRGARPVVILDINMSFNSMVWFMVKWVIASIPAMIILVVLFFLLSAFFGGLFAGLGKV